MGGAKEIAFSIWKIVESGYEKELKQKVPEIDIKKLANTVEMFREEEKMREKFYQFCRDGIACYNSSCLEWLKKEMNKIYNAGFNGRWRKRKVYTYSELKELEKKIFYQ